MTNTEMDNNLEKETEETNFEYTSEWLKQNTKIQGWLLFFLVVLILGGCFSFIYGIATFDPEDYAGSGCLIASDIFSLLFCLGIAIYAVYLFINRKPNSVFWGRCYLFYILISDLLVLFEPDETGLGSIPSIVRSIIWCIIWLVFLNESKQVQEIIPKSFRKVSKFDWELLAGIISIPILFLIIGTIQLELSGY